MRVKIEGTVVEVEKRSWKSPEGNTVEAFDAFIAAENPRYGADRISGPVALMPTPGESVVYRAVVNPRTGKNGPWLSVWCTDRADIL